MLTKTINIRIHNVTHEVEEYPYVIFKEKTKLRRGTKIESTYTTGKVDLQRTKDRILEKVETELLKNDGYTWKTLYNDEKRRTELDEGKVLPISKEDEEEIISAEKSEGAPEQEMEIEGVSDLIETKEDEEEIISAEKSEGAPKQEIEIEGVGDSKTGEVEENA